MEISKIKNKYLKDRHEIIHKKILLDMETHKNIKVRSDGHIQCFYTVCGCVFSPNYLHIVDLI